MGRRFLYGSKQHHAGALCCLAWGNAAIKWSRLFSLRIPAFHYAIGGVYDKRAPGFEYRLQNQRTERNPRINRYGSRRQQAMEAAVVLMAFTVSEPGDHHGTVASVVANTTAEFRAAAS